MSTQGQPGRARHPLEPLGAAEFRQAAAVLRRDRGIGARWRIASIELREPAKDALSAGTHDRPPREALVVCWNRDDGHAYRAVVSLDGDAVAAWEPLPGGQQPNITLDEWHECDEMLRSDPALAGALARRGITDRSRILTDLWAFGADLVPPRYRGRRLGWADVWYRGSEHGSPYAHHLSGLHPVVDLNQMALLEIDDSSGPGEALPEVMGEYLPKLIPMPLREVAPLEITQPAGVSFRLDGNLLQWQNWEVRLGFNYREGLVLHTVGFRDAGRLRPVAHRLSFAEMVVPYRDPTPDHFRRTAFDIGEWGLGFMTTSLERDFPTQSAADSGLPVWTAQNRPIRDTDVVLWYVFGIHHITRPEDWPIMPVDTVSFWLKPFGFFDRNPALDVPPGSNSGCHPGAGGTDPG